MRREDANKTSTTDDDELAVFLKRHHYSVDRGWSWVILVGSCVTNLVSSLMYSVGIFNVVFLDEFQRDRQTTAWLGSVQCSLISLIGLPAGYINNKLGPRVTTIMGALCGALGFFLSYFAKSFFFIFVTYGLLVGIYLQLLVVGTIMRPQRIPDELLIVEKRGTNPSSLNWISGSVLSLVTPTHSSLSELRPNQLLREKLCDGIDSQSHDSLRFYAQTDPTEPAPSEQLWNNRPDHDGGLHRREDEREEEGVAEKFLSVSDGEPPSRGVPYSNPHRRSIFTNKKLILLNIHYFFSNSACLIAYIHFPDYFLSKGASRSDITLMMTLIGICNSTSRLLCGVLANGIENVVLLVYMSASGLIGIILLLCPLLCSFHAGRMVFAVAFSLYRSALSALITPVTLELCSMEELSLAYGVELFFGGISGLVGPPFAGWLYDVSGDYMLSFLFAGSLYILGTLLFMITPILNGPIK